MVVGLFTVYGAWWLTNNNPKTALRNLIYNLFYNLNCGIFSSPITVCASFIVLFIILGSFLKVQLVWNLSDLFNALMVFPNLIALLARKLSLRLRVVSARISDQK